MDKKRETSKVAATLFDAITELEAVSSRLNGQVFGEMTPNSKAPNEGMPGGKITQAVSRIKDANSKLREVAAHLEELGK